MFVLGSLAVYFMLEHPKVLFSLNAAKVDHVAALAGSDGIYLHGLAVDIDGLADGELASGGSHCRVSLS
jgi:hypothetical protein